MVTLYRAKGQTEPRASTYYGTHAEVKPTNLDNGSYFVEVDTGAVYRYDKSGSQWLAQPVTATGGDIVNVNLTPTT